MRWSVIEIVSFLFYIHYYVVRVGFDKNSWSFSHQTLLLNVFCAHDSVHGINFWKAVLKESDSKLSAVQDRSNDWTKSDGDNNDVWLKFQVEKILYESSIINSESIHANSFT